MALNIPNVGSPGEALLNGVNTGSSMFSRLMQPILDREKQAQLERHFQEQLKLSKAAAGRAAQAAADAHKKMDPMYGINQYMALENWLKGQHGGMPTPVGGQQGAAMPAISIPEQEAGEGMGMFTPQGLNEAQQIPPQSNVVGGIDLDLMRKHPMLRGFAKQYLKFDPLAPIAQSPQEKQEMALDLFRQKEALKAQNKGGETPTNTVLTQNQQAIQGIDTVLPMLNNLIDNPDKVYGKWDFSPSKRAAYNAKTSGMIDTLVAAQSLPKVQASIDLVEQQIRRGTNESDDAYIKRLEDLREDLKLRRGKAQEVIKSRKVNTRPLPKETKTLGGKKYEKINGEWHEIH